MGAINRCGGRFAGWCYFETAQRRTQDRTQADKQYAQKTMYKKLPYVRSSMKQRLYTRSAVIEELEHYCSLAAGGQAGREAGQCAAYIGRRVAGRARGRPALGGARQASQATTCHKRQAAAASSEAARQAAAGRQRRDRKTTETTTPLLLVSGISGPS